MFRMYRSPNNSVAPYSSSRPITTGLGLHWHRICLVSCVDQHAPSVNCQNCEHAYMPPPRIGFTFLPQSGGADRFNPVRSSTRKLDCFCLARHRSHCIGKTPVGSVLNTHCGRARLQHVSLTGNRKLMPLNVLW